MNKKYTDNPQVNVRMPEALLNRLRISAEAAGRTLQAEIVFRLENSFPKRFDLLRLEGRQRELQALSDQIVQFEFALAELSSEMPEEQVVLARREIERMKKQEKEMWEEIGAMWSQQAKQEEPFSA